MGYEYDEIATIEDAEIDDDVNPKDVIKKMKTDNEKLKKLVEILQNKKQNNEKLRLANQRQNLLVQDFHHKIR